jgi:hypothetical protein
MGVKWEGGLNFLTSDQESARAGGKVKTDMLEA